MIDLSKLIGAWRSLADNCAADSAEAPDDYLAGTLRGSATTYGLCANMLADALAAEAAPKGDPK